jgi:DNA-binding response OmpR family regulator
MTALEVPPGSPRRLLLVSDDVASAEALRAHLVRHGFVVGLASSARTAASAARETEPVVVLVDAAIAGGWQSVAVALDPLLPRSRIAVLAAYWSTDARRLAEEAGIGGILLKQLEGHALVVRLHELGDAVASDGGTPSPRAAGITGGAS